MRCSMNRRPGRPLALHGLLPAPEAGGGRIAGWLATMQAPTRPVSALLADPQVQGQCRRFSSGRQPITLAPQQHHAEVRFAAERDGDLRASHAAPSRPSASCSRR